MAKPKKRETHKSWSKERPQSAPEHLNAFTKVLLELFWMYSTEFNNISVSSVFSNNWGDSLFTCDIGSTVEFKIIAFISIAAGWDVEGIVVESIDWLNLKIVFYVEIMHIHDTLIVLSI